MLKGLDQRLSADVLHALMRMGHGDQLLLCDVNHPSATIAQQTVLGHVLDLAGCDLLAAARAILSLMPLDHFIPEPVARMQVVGAPERELALFGQMRALAEAAEGRAIGVQVLERFAFYEAAKRAYCVIRTSDSGPYGCFLFTKGVVDLAPLNA